MKSRKQLHEFWAWFADNASTISPAPHQELLNILNLKLLELDPRLSWEIGPGRFEPWFLAISPNLDKDVVSQARAVVDAAPQIPGWEFYASRPAKQWDYRVEIDSDGRSLSLNAEDWRFVLLQYPSGLREVLLTSPNLPPLSEDERWQAAAIVLEGILGEQVLLEKVDEFDLVPTMEKRLIDRLRPITELKAALI